MMQSNSLRTLTQELMAAVIPVGTEEVSDVIRAAGWKSTGASVLVASVWKKAVGGDVNAAKLIREMNGEADNEGGSVDYSQMSDEMLRKMAEGEALLQSAEDKGYRMKDSSEDEGQGCEGRGNEGQGYRMKDERGSEETKIEEKYLDVWDQPKVEKPVTRPRIPF